MARVPGTYREPAGLRQFQEAVVAKARERGLDPHAPRIPDDLVDEVVHELYGGWTKQARTFVRLCEEL